MRHIRKISTQFQGFSIAELMVTVVIFTIISTGVYTTFLVGNRSWQANKVKVELQQELRKAMDWMKEDLRQSGTATGVISVAADGAPDTDITFKIAESISGGSIVWSEEIQYRLGGTNSDQLQRRIVATEEIKTIALDIQSLQITRQAATPEMVAIALQAQKNVPGGTALSMNSNFSVRLRN